LTWGTKKSEHNSKVAECDDLETAHSTTKNECDAWQHTLEEKACMYAMNAKAWWDRYDAAFTGLSSSYEDQRPGWIQDSNDRERQCTMAHRIVCLLDAMIANGEATGCDVKAYDCASVMFVPDATPAKLDFEATPVAPCNDNFEYGSFPDNAPAASCTYECVSNHAQPAIITKYFAGDVNYTPDSWATECASWPASVGAIRMTLHGKVDWFKPTQGETVCSMLQTRNKHIWSADGTTWVQPAYYPVVGPLGGSEADWPRDNVPGDERRYLHFWGSISDGSSPSGGCCSGLSEPDEDRSWGRSFVMEGIQFPFVEDM